jgi:hypothetical protein
MQAKLLQIFRFHIGLGEVCACIKKNRIKMWAAVDRNRLRFDWFDVGNTVEDIA